MIIAMWSGPRNLSTAMMRSFGSRADCAVWDEPFFAPFLMATGKDHPGRKETVATHETDPQKVAKSCLMPARCGAPYYFQKHMPHHMHSTFPLDWAKEGRHFFLIRHPARVISSYAKGRERFDIKDLGYCAQRRLHDQLTEMTGTAPPIVDCDDILRAPDMILPKLCADLNMPWDVAMLSWEAGPRESDGAWAPYWYGSVERSTGFSAPPKELPQTAPKYRQFYASALLDYAALYERRLTA